jgi:MerR family transcriptional regulator/heat shock protein HspR
MSCCARPRPDEATANDRQQHHDQHTNIQDDPVRGDDVMQFELTDDTPVYVISVAAQLSGLHPQTLRAYDRLGLVSPGRAAAGGPGRAHRRYSLRDILALREIQRLSQEEGVNLSGIKRILELENEEQRSRMRLAELLAEITQLRAELESTRAVAARLAGLLRSRNQSSQLVPVRRSDVSVTVQPSGRAQPDRAASTGAGALGRTAQRKETDNR